MKCSAILALFFWLSAVPSIGQDTEHMDSIYQTLTASTSTLDSAKAYLALASALYVFHPDSAIGLAEQARVLAVQSGDPFIMAQSLVRVSLKFINGGQYSSAVDTLLKADSFLDTTSMQKEVLDLRALLHRNLGTCYNYQNKHEKAIETHLKTLSIAKKAHNMKEIIYANYNIAVVHFSNQNYDRALHYQSNAYTAAVEAGDNMQVASALNLRGALFYYLSELDSAKIYSQQALDIAEKYDYQQPSIEAANVLASIYYTEEEYEQAAVYHKNILEKAKFSGNQYHIASVTGSLAETHAKMGDVTNARRYFSEFKKINEELNNLQLGKLNALNHAEFEKSLGNYRQAYELITDYVVIQDTLYSEENRRIQVDMEAKYDAAVKDTEIARQQNLLNQQSNQRKLLGGAGLISLLLAGFFWYRKRTSDQLRVQEKELDKQRITQLEKEKKILSMNAMIEGQEAERTRIAKDLHDGLGGLLSTVKAHFGNIQSEIKQLAGLKVYDRAQEMMDEACDEVRRISHNLMPGALRLEGLKSAVEQLGEEMSAAHSFEVKVEAVNFDTRLDESNEVFVYRIIQEAMNNIIKHADAKKVLIQMSESADQYHFIIEDDGKGFDPLQIESGLGLKSIQSRVDFLQGNLDVDTRIGVGTTLSFYLPK